MPLILARSVHGTFFRPAHETQPDGGCAFARGSKITNGDAPGWERIHTLYVRRLSFPSSCRLLKTLSESIELGASIFLDMIADASSPNERHPCRTVFIHRVEERTDNCDFLVRAQRLQV